MCNFFQLSFSQFSKIIKNLKGVNESDPRSDVHYLGSSEIFTTA